MRAFYVQFANLIMDATSQFKLEGLQRAAIRVDTQWYPHTTATEIYRRIKMDPVVDRAKRLTKNYLSKALWRKFIQVATKEADKLDFDYLHSTADIDSKITKITTAIQ